MDSTLPENVEQAVICDPCWSTGHDSAERTSRPTRRSSLWRKVSDEGVRPTCWSSVQM